MAPASDVPNKFDVVIDGNGYMKYRPSEEHAVYSFSPTFVERTNVEGDYGDNQQDFWLTFNQRDWSSGEQLKFYRSSSASKYWQGSNVDVRTAGQVSMRQALKTLTFAASVRACEINGTGVAAASTTNLYTVDSTGAITDQGAHGLGAAPSPTGIAQNAGDIYMTTTAAGTVGVRKWNGAVFSTFSASPADYLEALNNTLYGLRGDNGKLVRWDTAGTQSDIYQWKKADGSVPAPAGQPRRLLAFGSKLLAVFSVGTEDVGGGELWIYDGAGTSVAAKFPNNFFAWDACVLYGIVFIGGGFIRPRSGSATDTDARPAVYYYQNGTIGLLWQADSYASDNNAAITPVQPFDGGVVFTDQTTGKLMFYDPIRGGVHSMATYTLAGDTPLLIASQRVLLHTRNQTTAYVYPDATTVATTGTVSTSLVDFDSSLDKYFKAVKVDFDAGVGGNLGSVDVAYRLNDVTVTGAYTTVQTTAVAGTEYTIGQTARSISIKVTINKGTSTTPPVLKRISVRGAPILQKFRRRSYLLDLTGHDGETHVVLRDGTTHPKDGLQMATDLNTTMATTSPVSITDEFGTFSGILEVDKTEFHEIRQQEYYARVVVREV